jgi:hypothetical protein
MISRVQLRVVRRIRRMSAIGTSPTMDLLLQLSTRNQKADITAPTFGLEVVEIASPLCYLAMTDI